MGTNGRVCQSCGLLSESEGLLQHGLADEVLDEGKDSAVTMSSNFIKTSNFMLCVVVFSINF